MRDAEITVAADRTLTYADVGASDGAPILYFHGAPTSRLDLVPFDETLAAHHVRVLAPDRPGYGGSTANPGRLRADWTADAEQFLDTLGIDRVAVVGYSAGGPYAVEFAATCPERVMALGVLAGTTDMGWPGAWENYRPDDVEVLRLDDPDAAVTRCGEIHGADGSGIAEGLPNLAPRDEVMLADETMATALYTTMGEGLRQGILGYAEDAFAEGRAWTFNADAICVPAFVLHGEPDTIVPIAHGQHTAEVISNAELITYPDHGHLSLVLEAPALLERLAALR